MQRNTQSFTLQEEAIASFKNKMLNRCNRFNICCLLDNHHYVSAYNSTECLAAFGAIKTFSPKENILQELAGFYAATNDWIFGHLGYDLQKETEGVFSTKRVNKGFEDIFLFVPETVVELNNGTVLIHSVLNCTDVFNSILNEKTTIGYIENKVNIKPKISKEAYLKTIQKLEQHILKGDCYEINFCQEFCDENATINPVEVYKKLAQISPTPFGAFYKINNNYALCASPERYLKKEGNKLISQPIKGTVKRNVADLEQDNILKQQLYNSAKDRSENVMVVDLVRNDLSRICKNGTVKVDELYGIYTYPTVHQMISTISGEVEGHTNLADILKTTFPMGSMTGAPKKRVLELIEQYEASPRGLFSGSIGYITPKKDFDFNVVIRSIFYNSVTHLLQYFAGGGITFYSNAQGEYEESMLKAEGMKRALE